MCIRDRSFGPVSFNKIGISYRDKKLWFVLNAGLSTGGLEMDMMGLSIGSPIKEFSPSFHLDGIGLSYQSENLEIGGAFYNKPTPHPEDFNFIGEATLRTKSFSIMIVGQYAKTNEVPSMFLFGQMDAALGGPPIFFVTGLSMGFGYNSSIKIPEVSQVKQFPFVSALEPGHEISPAGMMDKLTGSDGYLQQKMGSKWVAAGVKFESFQLIKSNLLAIAQFEENFQIALLGTSFARFPQKGAAYASVDLQIKAIYQPNQGFLGIDAQLEGSSFIIDESCHLVGGIAFYTWMGNNPHSGDFVFSIGGYHPNYIPPSHYPHVPRLGFNWRLGSDLNISGDSYFAMTPKQLMAGFNMSADYSKGRLKAWFRVGLDMLLNFKPFSYLVDAYANLGASYTIGGKRLHKTFRINIGAAMKLWGPPTGGTVTFHIWKLSFTIPIGSAYDSSNQYLHRFHDESNLDGSFSTLLPEGESVLQVMPLNGVVPKSTPETKSMVAVGSLASNIEDDKSWLVNPDNYQFSIKSAIPIKKLSINGKNYIEDSSSFDITPLGQAGKGVSCSISVTINKLNGKQEWEASPDWDIQEPQKENLPTALWSSPSDPNAHLLEHYTSIVLHTRKKEPEGEISWNPSEPGEILDDRQTHILPFNNKAVTLKATKKSKQKEESLDKYLLSLDQLPSSKRHIEI